MKNHALFSIGIAALLIAGLAYLFFVAAARPGSNELGYVPVEVENAKLLEAYAASAEAMNVVIDIPVPSFVTVHTAIGSAPGPIIGQSGYIEPNKHMTSMKIDPLMVSGMTYIVLVHKDNGDSLFSLEEDLPIMNDGKVLRADVVAP